MTRTRRRKAHQWITVEVSVTTSLRLMPAMTRTCYYLTATTHDCDNHTQRFIGVTVPIQALRLFLLFVIRLRIKYKRVLELSVSHLFLVTGAAPPRVPLTARATLSRF